MRSVIAICTTKNRHTHLEKLVRCFLDQDYEGPHTLLIYNNAFESQELGKIDLPENKKIILINNCMDLKTGMAYTNLGSVYRDALQFLTEDYDIATHMDDDDVYLPCHISEGVKGLERGEAKLGIIRTNCFAYKPAKSYYLDSIGLTEQVNTLEPSIFVNYKYLREAGYFETNVDLHHKWLNALNVGSRIFVDEDGPATFIYDWSGMIPVWKTSGDPNNPENFNNYTKNSKDWGDRLITPVDPAITKYYLNLTK